MKQKRNNNFSRQFCGLAIAALMTIFAVGCSRTETSVNVNTTANTNSANTNTTAVSDTAANVNSANSDSNNANTAAAKSIKDEILGTWIQQKWGNPKVKFVFTKDEATKVIDGKNGPASKYVWLNDREIEIVVNEAVKVVYKVTLAGDDMTLESGGVSFVCKRESADTGNAPSPDSDSAKNNAGTEPQEDCQVKTDNSNFFVTATEKDMKLKKGTPISWTIPDMHQGIIVVKAKVDDKWIQGEIKLDDTTCNDEEKK